MIRTFLFAVIAALVTACGSTDVDPETRDLLRRDMTAVATAVAAEDYITANEALRRLLDDTDAAYQAGEISVVQRSDIAAAAAKLQADIDAALAPPVAPVPVQQEGGGDEGGDSGGEGNGGKGKDKDKGGGNGKGKN